MNPAVFQQVYWDEKIPEYGELAALFGFQSYMVESSSKYAGDLMKINSGPIDQSLILTSDQLKAF